MQSSRPCMLSRDCGPLAKSVNNSISTALNRTFEGQNPKPTCKIDSGDGCSFTVFPRVYGFIERAFQKEGVYLNERLQRPFGTEVA